MSNVKNETYRAIPFCPETRYNDFYPYVDLSEIAEKCDSLGNEVIKCRTVGLLESTNGRFYLSDFSSKGTLSEPIAQVSVVYLQSPPGSTVIPYPVQIFGTLQWKNRPVVFAKILQVLTVPVAIRLKDTLKSITSLHLATNIPQNEYEDD